MSHSSSPVRTAMLGFTILVFSMGIGRFAFTPLLPVMQNENLLSISEAGALASVHFVGYAMGALLGAALTALPRTTLIGALVGVSLSTLSMGLTENHLLWLIARWMTGVCSALVLVVVSTHFLQRLTEAGRPDLQGLVFSGVGAGTAVTGFVMLVFMANSVNSTIGWLTFGIAALGATGLLLRSLRADLFQSTHRLQSRSASCGVPAWRIILPYGAMGAGYIIPATYLPVMAQQSISSPLVFGWGWPIFGIAAAISTLLSSRLHRAYSNRQIWVVSQVIMATGLILPALAPSIATIAISAACVGGTFMVVTMAGLKEAHRMTGNASAQTLVALMTAAFALGQIVGPVLAGWAYSASDSFSYPLIAAAGLLLVSLIPMTSARVASPPTEQYSRLRS
ncbi:MAG: YbfB/YjiJ family MFS transporter [Hyphomicrobiaceae bacterium]